MILYIGLILLALFFIYLLKYLNDNNLNIEGIDSTDSTDPLVLAQNNSSAISGLQKKIKHLGGVQHEVVDLSNQVLLNTTQLKSINKNLIKSGYSNFGRDGPPKNGLKLPVIKGNDGDGIRVTKSKASTSDLPMFPSKY